MKRLPPVARAFDLDTLVACLSDENAGIDTANAVLHTGWQNAVIETHDGWIFRFPRTENLAFSREVTMLRELRPRLPVDIPNVQRTGLRTRFAAYPKLLGTTLDMKTFASSSPRKQESISESLATFLAEMHVTFTPAQARGLGVPSLSSEHLVTEVAKKRDDLSSTVRPTVSRLERRFINRWVENQNLTDASLRVLHNDFHFGNMVFGDSTESVSGVWDFSCVELGEPSYDLRYLFPTFSKLASDISARYTRLTGLEIDLEAAELAGRYEAVSDALVERRDVRAELHFWSRASTDR